MKAVFLAIGTIAMLSISSVSLADNTRDPGVNARQQIQKQRVIEGVKSGELTHREAHRLVQQQRKIKRLERAYKADGHLTKVERRNLHRAQNRASRSIYRQKHDAQSR